MTKIPEARSNTYNRICVKIVSKKIQKYSQKETISYTQKSISCTKKKVSVQEERKRDQEHKILSWFTLPQRLRPVLCKLAKIFTKKISKINFTQYNSCTPQANPAPNSKQPTEPYNRSSTSTEPTVLSSYNYTPYVICNNCFTKQENSMNRTN